MSKCFRLENPRKSRGWERAGSCLSMFQKKKVGADKQDVRKTVWEAEELSATV